MKLDNRTFTLTDRGSFGKWALACGILGLILTVIGYFVNPARMFNSYLVSFGFWTTLGLGALFFVMLHHLTNATWSVVLRRLVETFMAVLPYMVIFVLPVLLNLNELYRWSRPEAVMQDHLLQHKAPYLNDWFFILRTGLYFAAWFIMARSLYRTSLAQDSGFDKKQVEKFRKISAPGMVLFALTITFAGFDWFMSQDPDWYSTIFGVYIFSGGLVSILAFITLSTLILRRRGVLSDSLTGEHYHDLGKLTFAFVVFWGYIAFSQYFLIWYANIPEETTWFHHRYQGGWESVSLLMVFGYFVVPFVALISRGPKRSRAVMAVIAAWLLVMHWVDLYWIIMPNYSSHQASISWMDFAAMLLVGGFYLWMFWRKFSSRPVVPVGDPRLEASINFVSG
jgi:hypothetical protein